MRTSCVYPIGDICNRAFAVICRLIGFDIGKAEWKLTFRNRNPSTLLAIYERNRLSPISLTGEYPVTELIIRLWRSEAFLFKELDNLLFCFGNFKPIEKSGIDHFACLNIRECLVLNIAASNDFDYRKIKLLRKIPVTCVVCGNCHDGTRAIGHKDIVRNEDRNFLSVYGVDRRDSVKTSPRLILCKLCSLKIRFLRRGLNICLDLVIILDDILPLFNIRMLRRDYHVCSTEKCVRTCCVDSENIACRCLELNLSTV